MYIKPFYSSAKSSDPCCCGKSTQIVFPDTLSEERKEYLSSAMRDTELKGKATEAEKVIFELRKPNEKDAGVSDSLIGSRKDEYVVVFGKETRIIAETPDALVYGANAFRQAVEFGESSGVIYNHSEYKFRGYRTYLPGKTGMEAFKKAVDLMAYYQYNTMILEVGGAMEYKKHPEINKAWLESVEKFRKESGLTKKVQNMYSWAKNSIHAENGDGEVLTQDTVREIVAYCRTRGIKVIPEVPTLSHSDYLLLPHPEFAERPYDSYPDAYCPCHPDIYPYVFDVLDEVADVFKPEYFNIGHDECYNIAVDTCPRCAGKVASDLYTQDIVKISFHLENKGIKSMMWGDKLLPAYINHMPQGGSELWWHNRENGDPIRISPYLADCAYKIPRQITMLHWYWAHDERYDDRYTDNGFDMVFGNSSLADTEHWDRRKNHCIGAIASNWGSFGAKYMQRNLQNFDLIYNSRALSGHDYTDSGDERSRMIDDCMDECYRQAHRFSEKDVITVTHTTSHNIPYVCFYVGIYMDDEKYLLGNYELTFDDGFVASLPVRYGENISNCSTENRTTRVVGDDYSDKKAKYRASSAYREVNGSAVPFLKDGTIYYKTAYENPHKGHKIVKWEYKKLIDADVVTLELK